MNSYNGFEPKQRYKALKWFREQQRLGFRPIKPTKCDVCTQTKGALEYHSEDYSDPFGANIGQFGLCYTCHMMIHCRYKSINSWNVYKKALEEKKVFQPFYSRNWIWFKKQCLTEKFAFMDYELVKENNYKVLLEIEAGTYIPKKKVIKNKEEQLDIFSV